MTIPASDWLDILEREYLHDFIIAGGAAVKFVVAADESLAFVQQRLREDSERHDLVFVPIDAARTRLHMIQDVFFAIARAVDWSALAQLFVENLFARNGYRWPQPGEVVPIQDLATVNRIDVTILSRDIRQWLTDEVMRDRHMTQDFRVAMTQICLRRMEAAPSGADFEEPIAQWLKGELRTISALKNAPITAKVTRYNGRAMLRSACRWLRKCSRRGLCLALDIRQLGKSGKPTDNGARYGPGAVMDAFEVLRQLIDDAEHFAGMLLVVLAGETLTSDDRTRSLDAYLALKWRIWDDVRPKDRDNPLAPLVHLAGPATTGRPEAF